MALSKSQVLSPTPPNMQRVDVPEWGDESTPIEQRYVFVRVLSGEELDWYEASLYVQNGTKFVADRTNGRAKLCALCMCDDQGNDLFETNEIPALGKVSNLALDRVFRAAKKLNRLGVEGVEAEVKNSDSDRASSGGTESQPA